MHLVVFEGMRWSNFAPMSFSRPVFAMPSGLSNLLDKQLRHLKPSRLTLWVRPEMVDYCKRYVAPDLKLPVSINTPLDDQPALLSSGRVLHLGDTPEIKDFSVIIDGDLVRKAYVKSPGLSHEDCLQRSAAWLKLMDLPRATEQARLADYIWDLVHWNEEAIVADAIEFRQRRQPLAAGPYHVVAADNVIVDKTATIAPGVVLDGSKGPVVIDAGAAIQANSVLKGPCYIGPHCIIGPLALIREGVSIGPMCRVGGEVAQTIMSGCSNKAHDGYLGHSFIGQWVNLGAGTTTSNLKNTYGPIRMQIGKKQIDTDRRFMGSMIGDHTKTAIGTRLMTGSYVGYCSLLASSKMPSKYTPSFTFVTDKGVESYQPRKAKEVMTQVFARRQRTWSEHDDEMLLYAQRASQTVEN